MGDKFHEHLKSASRRAADEAARAYLTASILRYGKGWTGALGTTPRIQVSVRFLYPPAMSALQALADIEDAEPELPGPLVMALAFAARALDRQAEPWRVRAAALTAALLAQHGLAAAVHPFPPPLSRRQIEALAQRYRPGSLQGDAPARPSDAARLTIELGRRLWDPAWLAAAPALAREGTLAGAA